MFFFVANTLISHELCTLCRFVKELDGGVGEKAQLGLGHSYSRAKVRVCRYSPQTGETKYSKHGAPREYHILHRQSRKL